MQEPPLTTGILYDFPILKCRFNRQKITSFTVVRVLLDSGASPCEAAPACQSNGILCENFCQRSRELTIKRRNIGAVAHVT